MKMHDRTATFRTCKIGRNARSAIGPGLGSFVSAWVTWWEEVLDRGSTARGAGGMDDGVDGQFAETLPTAPPPIMPVVDGIGRRVPELVLLDGAGRPATAGSTAEKTESISPGERYTAAHSPKIPFPILKEA